MFFIYIEILVVGKLSLLIFGRVYLRVLSGHNRRNLLRCLFQKIIIYPLIYVFRAFKFLSNL